MSYVLSKKTVSTAKGVGVSSEKYPKLHLVDVMSDTWYPIPPPPAKHMENDSFYQSSFSPLKDEIKFSRADSSHNSGEVAEGFKYFFSLIFFRNFSLD